MKRRTIPTVVISQQNPQESKKIPTANAQSSDKRLQNVSQHMLESLLDIAGASTKRFMLQAKAHIESTAELTEGPCSEH